LQVPELTHRTAERGIAGFTQSADLVIPCEGECVVVGKLAWGGASQNSRTYLSLSGTLCSRVENWTPLGMVLHLCDARITRVDLAHDDFEGTRSVDEAVAMYDAGAFNSGGRNPGCELQGDWKEVSGRGRTFYVGRKTHGKLLRVYEKGKQLGKPDSPWVRWEVEFHNRDRWIPYDVLSKPARFLAGAFPALAFVCEEREAIKTQRKAVQASLEHLITWMSKSYGKTINALAAGLRCGGHSRPGDSPWPSLSPATSGGSIETGHKALRR
jgi:phage replication initiation protein